jgi:hypothetical protein
MLVLHAPRDARQRAIFHFLGQLVDLQRGLDCRDGQ